MEYIPLEEIANVVKLIKTYKQLTYIDSTRVRKFRFYE